LLLDKYGSKVIGLRREEMKYGEVFYLDLKKALRLLPKSCNLYDSAQKTSVKLALTVDGTDLFKGRTHVSTGVKIVDKRGVHSVTKQPFMINDVDNDQIDFIKVQSLELCCIMMIAELIVKNYMKMFCRKDFYRSNIMAFTNQTMVLNFSLLLFCITMTSRLHGSLV
jgi:hypothetical protein